MARKHQRPLVARLNLERLEDRAVPTANISLDPATHVLSITGTTFDDKAHVYLDGGNVVAKLSYDSGSGTQTESKTFDVVGVASILFTGGDGNDCFCNDTSLPARATGDAGNDYLEGGLGNDKLFGGAGDDVLVGCKGNDKLVGDAGNDWLFGLQSDDRLEGGTGNDGLYGGTGGDTLTDTSGKNKLDGKYDGPVGEKVNGFASAKLQAYLDSQDPAPPSTSQIEKQIIDLVNAERTKRGLRALTINDKLTGMAQHHATNMAKYKTMAHDLPQADLPSLVDRLNFYGYKYRSAGENIAWNYADASSVMNAWMNSSGHRANILNANYTEIGVGVRYASNGEPYYCQEFGQPA